jgi:hypothetical protein
MSRHVHLWFLTGVLLGMTGTFSVWLAAMMAGELWSSQWGWIVAVIDAVIFPWAVWEWRQRWKRCLTGRRGMSHEMRCRWDFARRKPEPACARRMRDGDWYVGG